jgi:hypothetical protein
MAMQGAPVQAVSSHGKNKQGLLGVEDRSAHHHP